MRQTLEDSAMVQGIIPGRFALADEVGNESEYYSSGDKIGQPRKNQDCQGESGPTQDVGCRGRESVRYEPVLKWSMHLFQGPFLFQQE